MKKLLSIILAMALVLSIGGILAFADSNQGSQKAKRNFDNYIATLDDEQAQWILEDEELVYMMQMDNYWAPQVKSDPRAVSLPLAAYPSGSFYTVNKAACSDHSICTYTMPSPKPATVVDTKCYNGNTKKNGNCIRYAGTGAIQCKGFADYVFKQYTGSDISSSSAVTSLTSITNNDAGATAIQNYIANLPVGSNIRAPRRDGTFTHSFIISAKSDTGITVYDCNGTTSACKVANTTKTWRQLATTYKSMGAWKAS